MFFCLLGYFTLRQQKTHAILLEKTYGFDVSNLSQSTYNKRLSNPSNKRCHLHDLQVIWLLYISKCGYLSIIGIFPMLSTVQIQSVYRCQSVFMYDLFIHLWCFDFPGILRNRSIVNMTVHIFGTYTKKLSGWSETLSSRSRATLLSCMRHCSTCM